MAAKEYKQKQLELLMKTEQPTEQTEPQTEQPNDDELSKLLDELMILKFRIKLTKDLYKAGVKNTKPMRKKLTNIYFRKLKLFCTLNKWDFDKDLVKLETSLKLDELKREMKVIMDVIL